MGSIVSRLGDEVGILTDKRIQVMSEIMAGIKVVKMYAWEKHLAKVVDSWRRYVANISLCEKLRMDVLFLPLNLANRQW